MENTNLERTEKNIVKQKNREATMKHYVLGYILECVKKNDATVIDDIKKFLVHDIQVITEKSFVCCLNKARCYYMMEILEPKYYRNIKASISLIFYGREKQLEIIRQMKRFAENYEDGIYVNANIGTSSFKSEMS